MSIISGVVRRPVSILVIMVLLCILSLFTATKISIDLLPDVAYPHISIYTTYPGVNPETVEETITKPIEATLRGLKNMVQVSSRSDSGISVISLEFKYGSDIDELAREIETRLDRIKSGFPKEVVAPMVFHFSGTDLPAVRVVVASNRNVNDVRQYIDENLLSYFEQIPGVARVEVSGGSTKRVLVETSVNRLNALGLTLSDIQNTIKSNGERTSLGYIQTETTDLALVLDNKFDNLEELKNLIIANRTTDTGEVYPVKIQDVADISFGYDELASNINTINGRPSVELNLYKTTGTSIVDVAEASNLMMKNIAKIAPKDFEFFVFDDEATFIANGMKAVGSAAGGGGLLAILILLIFLRNFRSVLIIGISMPISILFTFMFMYFAGLTLNAMTLAGLALGIGMLVDNSVVVLEHIYNKRLRGVKMLPSSEYGAREMARPVLAATLTTVLVFAPVLLFKDELGMMGGYVSALAFTVVVSVMSSYFVAIFFVPVLTSKYIKIYQSQPKGILKHINRMLEFCLEKLNESYQKRIRIMLEKPKRYLLLIVVLALVPIIIVVVRKPGFSLFPTFPRSEVAVYFEFPTFMTKDVKYEYVQDFQERTEYIFEKYGVSQDNVMVRVNSRSGGGLWGSGSNTADLIIQYKKDVTSELDRKITKEYQTFTNIYPGVLIDLGWGGRGWSGGGDFSLKMRSHNYDVLREKVIEFKKLIEKNFDGKITNITDDQGESATEYSLKVNRELANTYGISVSALVQELQSAVMGKTVNTYTEGASEYDIFVRLNAKDRSRADLVEQLYVNGNGNTRIPVANLVEKSYGLGVSQILRSDFQRTIGIQGSVVPPYTITQAVSEVRSMLEGQPGNNEVTYFFAGEFKKIQESSGTLIMIFLLAVLFIYGVMVSQFESFLDPFIIVFTVPLTFSGVVLIYMITQNYYSMFTLIGVVMLVGIAVNHGIVLVDYMNLLRNRGYKLKEAIVQGCENRLQPILMTTATTVIGLLPLVIFQIPGAEMVKPLALTVVGGLSSSALLSLFLIPLMYLSFKKRQVRWEEKSAKKHKKREEYMLARNRKLNRELGVAKD